jgi:hypothetical protein
MSDDFILKWNSIDEQLYGEDPDTGDRIPIPLDSISTENVENSSLNDGINYINPPWLARTKAVHTSTFFESLDGVEHSISGSGTVGIESDARGVEISTGTTSESHAQVNANKRSHLDTWENDRSAYFEVSFPDISGTKWIISGKSASNEHIGFKLDNGDLLGTVADGSAESTTTLNPSIQTRKKRLRADLSAGSTCDFYVGDINQGSLSSNLPTGQSFSTFYYLLRVENSSSTDSSLMCGRTITVQQP